jgi:Raf kinase inhibitor-like YbhB/YbcL family protein
MNPRGELFVKFWIQRICATVLAMLQIFGY